MATSEEKLDKLLDSHTELRLGVATLIRDMQELARTHVDFETRIRALEKARWTMVGAAGMVGGIASEILRFMAGSAS